MTAVSILVLLAMMLAGPVHPAGAQSGKQVMVVFELRQSATQSRDAVDGSGRVVITDRGGVRSSGRVGADSTQRRTQTSTGIFTLVQDGGESTLVVARQVPYQQVAFYRDYLTGAGYVATGVQFTEVGTSLKVGAVVLAGNQVKLRLTPTVSWLSGDKSGVIEATEASTTLVVPSGQPVVIGGATTQTHELVRQILGYSVSQNASETTMVLTATIR
jgi:hypothetical protein